MRLPRLISVSFAVVFTCLSVRPARAAEPPAVPPQFLRDYAETRGFTLGRPVGAKPTPDGKAVLFLRAKSARVPSLELQEFDVASGRTRLLLSPEQALAGATEQLSAEEKARRERQRVSVGGFTAFEMSKNGACVLLSLSGKLYVLTRATGEVSELATGAGTIVDPKWAPDGKHVSYVRDFDLCVFDLAERRERAVTRGGTETVTHGLAEFVAQEEMGRFTGYWWSPDSRQIAFEESDASNVESWFVADPAKPGQPPLRSFYPRPGKKNVAVRVGIVSAADGGEPVWITWDHATYPYLAQVDWREYAPLTLVVQTRDQRDLDLLEVDPQTGRTTPLVDEHDEAWLNLDQDMPRWLSPADGGGFLWTSESSGGWQLERRDRAGDVQATLVPAFLGYRGLVGVAGGQVYFRASADPTQTQLWRVPLHGGEPVALTTAPGLHNAEIGANNSPIYLHQIQTLQAMPRTFVRRWADSTVVGELPSIAQEPSLPVRAELVKVGSSLGFHALVIRPRDFDANAHRRYPVIVDVYGGPHHNQVTAALRPYLLDQWLADQGFIVVAADGRGTPGRGRIWERAIAGKFGDVPLADQMQALKTLGGQFPEMDLERVGITGWSFGGYMAALAVLRAPEIFKAAVAGAPVTDWLDYDTHYTERYLGLPQTSPEAYQSASLLTGVEKLRRPLLLIHGTADDNVYFRHSLRLGDALFRAGRPFEILPLPSLTHMVPDPVVREQLSERIARHFHEHLGAPTAPGTP